MVAPRNPMMAGRGRGRGRGGRPGGAPNKYASAFGSDQVSATAYTPSVLPDTPSLLPKTDSKKPESPKSPKKPRSPQPQNSPEKTYLEDKVQIPEEPTNVTQETINDGRTSFHTTHENTLDTANNLTVDMTLDNTLD